MEKTLCLVDDSRNSSITDAMIGYLEEPSCETGFTNPGRDCFAGSEITLIA